MALKISGLSTRNTSLRDQPKVSLVAGHSRARVIGGRGPAITITGASVAENTAAGTAIGTLGVANVTGTPTFTLVDAAGGLAALSGGSSVVRGATALNFETTPSFDIIVGVSGVTPTIPNRTIRVGVINVAEQTLAALTLSAATVAENTAAGAVIGNVQGLTAGSTLSLIDDAGGRFSLNGSNQIVTGLVSTDYETATSHSITLRETNADGINSPRDTTLTITVTDVADTTGLIALTLSSASILESAAQGTVVGAFQNKTSGSTLSLTDDAGARFAISGGNLVRGTTALNYETATSHSVVVRETLAGAVNSPRDTTLTVNVTNVLEVTLSALTLSAASVAEGTAAGAVIGNVQGKTSGSTLSLTDSAGSRFALNGSDQLITGSVATNYETATSHSITIRETHADGTNSPRDTTLTITVTNVLEVTLAALTLSANTIAENSAAGTVVGAIQNTTSGSTLSLTVDAGGRFAISGSNLVAGSTATDYETATSHSITIRETHADGSNSPRDTTLSVTVTNVAEGGAVTWNPSDKEAGITLSSGNLTATSSANGQEVRATQARTPSGTSYYFEVTLNTAGASLEAVGLANATFALTGFMGDNGSNSNGLYSNGTMLPSSDFAAAFAAGDVVGVELLASTAKWTKNGTLIYTLSSLPTGALFPMATISNGGSLTANFGASAFAHLPSGATAWDGSAGVITPVLTFNTTSWELELDIAPAALTVGRVITWEVYSDAGLTSLYDSGTNTLDAGDVAAGTIIIAADFPPGMAYARAKENLNDTWSNTEDFWTIHTVVVGYGQSNRLFAIWGGSIDETVQPDTYVWEGSIGDGGLDGTATFAWEVPPGHPGTSHGIANGAAHFLNRIKEYTGKPVGMVWNAASGAALVQLAEGGDFAFAGLAQNIADSGCAAAPNIVIAYHQGEGDAAGLATGQATWLADLADLHQDICDELGKTKAQVPFIVSSLAQDEAADPSNTTYTGNWVDQQELIQLVQGSGTNMHYSHSNVDAVLSGDGIHWDSGSYARCCDREAQTAIRVLFDAGEPYPRWGFASTGTRQSNTVTRVQIVHGPGNDLDASRQTALTGFTVKASGGSWITATGARVDATHIDLTHSSIGTASRDVRFCWGTDYDTTKLPLDNSGISGVGVPPSPTTNTPITVAAASDTTAPTLSSPSGTQTGSTTADLAVSTNEGNGTLYAVVTTSSTSPSAAQVKAGQNNTGGAAVYASSQAVSSTGTKTFNATGLTASTAYYAYFMHEDAATNQSSVAASASFTTASGGLAALTSILPAGSVLRLFDTQGTTGVTVSSGHASAWAEESGTGANASQGTAANQPTYNTTGWDCPDDTSTIAAVTPNIDDPASGNDYMDFTSPATTDGYSIVIVTDKVDSGTDRIIIGGSGDNDVTLVWENNDKLTYTNSWFDFFNSTTAVSNGQHIIAINVDASTWELFVDGVSRASGSAPSGHLPAGVRRLFGNRDTPFSAARPSKGATPLIAICKRMSTSGSPSNYQKLEGWAAHRTKSKALLPSGHPFKTTPPT